jgi:hypothetical protein
MSTKKAMCDRDEDLIADGEMEEGVASLQKDAI